MTPAGRGFLLLCSHLGNPDRHPLTAAQLRQLAVRVTGRREETGEGSLTPQHLVALGYSWSMARHITGLMGEEALLDRYLTKAGDCVPIPRGEGAYPLLLRQRLGLDSPGCLWARGNEKLLHTPAVALVGSRDIGEPNGEFARQVGIQAARQGLTLVSGNARGADRMAQRACLQAGGRVISIVADDLRSHPGGENLLFLSQEDYDAPFSAQRALSRNRCIHALGLAVFVAQAELGQGGSWDGTVKNLHQGWSPVACFADGSEAMARLMDQGAAPVSMAQLGDLRGFAQRDSCLWQ